MNRCIVGQIKSRECDKYIDPYIEFFFFFFYLYEKNPPEFLIIHKYNGLLRNFIDKLSENKVSSKNIHYTISYEVVEDRHVIIFKRISIHM